MAGRFTIREGVAGQSLLFSSPSSTRHTPAVALVTATLAYKALLPRLQESSPLQRKYFYTDRQGATTQRSQPLSATRGVNALGRPGNKYNRGFSLQGSLPQGCKILLRYCENTSTLNTLTRRYNSAKPALLRYKAGLYLLSY